MKHRNKTLSHERAQADGLRWADAMRIMGALRRVQVDTWDPHTGILEYAAGLKWTAEACGVHAGIISNGTCDLHRVIRALMFLCKQSWVMCIARGKDPEYRAQLYGLEQYDAVSKRPEINSGASYLLWKNEALCGVDEFGRKSNITWAACPKDSHNDTPRNIPEEEQLAWCGTVEYIHRIALDNNCSDSDAITMLGTGEIHRCNVCGKQKRHHRDRKYWKSPCVDCRKVNRP